MVWGLSNVGNLLFLVTVFLCIIFIGGMLAKNYKLSIRPRVSWIAGILCILLLGWIVYSGKMRALAKNEGWLLQSKSIAEKFESSRGIQIYPTIVKSGQRQRFYINRGVADDVKVKLGQTGISSIRLGANLTLLQSTGREISDQGNSDEITLNVGNGKVQLQWIRSEVRPELVVSSISHGFVAALSPSTDEVIILDKQGNIDSRFQVRDRPMDLLIQNDGNLVIGHSEGVSRISREGIELQTVPFADPVMRIAEGPADIIAVVTSKGKLCIVRASGELDWIDSPGRADKLAIWQDKLLALSHREGELWIFDTKSGALVNTLILPRPTREICVSKTRVYISATGYSTDPAEPRKNHEIHHILLEVDPSEAKVVRVFDTESLSLWPAMTHLGRLKANRVFDYPRKTGLDPGRLSIASDGSVLTVFRGSNEVGGWNSVLNQSWRCGFGGKKLQAPASIADVGDGGFVVADPLGGRLFFGEPQGEWKAIHLDGKKKNDPVHRGEAAFYASTTLGLSCQSCHHDVSTDFGYHNIGSHICLTLTTSGIGGTAPYFRIFTGRGKYSDLVQLHSDAIKSFGGYNQEQEGTSEDVEAFLEAIPRLETELESPEILRAGYAAFQKASCAICHSGPRFTNGGQISAAWLFPGKGGPNQFLDVPSLLLTNDNFPESKSFVLEDLFVRHNTANRHGNSRILTEREFDDLLKFLRAL